MSLASGVVTGGTTLLTTTGAIDQPNKTSHDVDSRSAEGALKTYVKNQLSSLLRHRHSHYDLQTSLPLAPLAPSLITSKAPSECQLVMATQNGNKSHLAPTLTLAQTSADNQHSGTSEINNNQEDAMNQGNVSCNGLGTKHDFYAPLGEANSKLVDNSVEQVVIFEVANNLDKDGKAIETKPNDGDKETQEKEKDDNGSRRTKQLLFGIFLTILSGLCFSITTLVVSYVTNVSPGTMAAFRYLGIIWLSLPLVIESGQPILGPRGAYPWIFLRGVLGGTSVFFRYSALHYMTMADSTIIILSMPVFVFVFARIILKEHFGRYHLIALMMSIIGIIFASKIEFFFPSSFVQSSNGTEVNQNLSFNDSTLTSTQIYQVTTLNETSYDAGTFSLFKSDQMIGTAFSLGATLIGCFVYIIIRKIKDVNKSVILFNFSIISFFEMMVINYFFYDFELPKDGWNPYLIVLVGLLSFYAQLLLTRAIQIEEAGVVSVVRTSSEAFFAFLLQIFAFHQIPDAFSLTGAILVLSAVVLISMHKYLRGLPENNPTRKRFRYLAQ